MRKAADEMEQGLADANLGVGAVEERAAPAGRGKRGGAGTLVAVKTRDEDRRFFLFGFRKSERADIPAEESDAFREIAKRQEHCQKGAGEARSSSVGIKRKGNAIDRESNESFIPGGGATVAGVPILHIWKQWSGLECERHEGAETPTSLERYPGIEEYKHVCIQS